MAGKFGSPSAWLFVDGYDFRASKVQEMRRKIEALQQRTDGLGDSWEEHTPTGLRRVTVAQTGAFYDTATNALHAAMTAASAIPTSPQDASRVVCLGFAGQTVGEEFDGFEGAFTVEYEPVASNGELTRANVVYVVSGQHSAGLILHELSAETVDFNSEGTADAQDNGASSANGGVGFQQVTAFSGFTGYIGKVRHSTDDISYADLVTFADVTAAPSAERVAVSGTVNRYLAVDGNVTGTGSITVFIGFARNP